MTDYAEEKRKWEFLRDAPARDAQTPEIRYYAHNLWLVAQCSKAPHWVYANLALCMARDCIAYRLDSDRVGREQIDGYTDPQGSADMAFIRGEDDCDAKARFFVALCLAGGIQAHMMPRWEGQRLAHVFAEALVAPPGSIVPNWLPAETILRRARLGEIAENVPVEKATGKWLK